MKLNFVALMILGLFVSTVNGQTSAEDLTPEQFEAFIAATNDPVRHAAFAGFMMANQPAALDTMIAKQLVVLSGPKSECQREITSYCPSAKGEKIVDCLKGKTTGASCTKQLEAVTTLIDSKRTIEAYNKSKAAKAKGAASAVAQ